MNENGWTRAELAGQLGVSRACPAVGPTAGGVGGIPPHTAGFGDEGDGERGTSTRDGFL